MHRNYHNSCRNALRILSKLQHSWNNRFRKDKRSPRIGSNTHSLHRKDLRRQYNRRRYHIPRRCLRQHSWYIFQDIPRRSLHIPSNRFRNSKRYGTGRKHRILHTTRRLRRIHGKDGSPHKDRLRSSGSALRNRCRPRYTRCSRCRNNTLFRHNLYTFRSYRRSSILRLHSPYIGHMIYKFPDPRN